MKTLAGIIICLLLQSCYVDHNESTMILFRNNTYQLNCSIFRNDSSIIEEFKYAHGLGRESDSIFSVKREDIFQNIDDTVFNLPININSDSITYCLVRHDGTRDTIEISYERKRSLNEYNYVFIAARNLKINRVSDGILRDSCTIDNANHIPRHTYKPLKFNLKLVMK